MILVDSSAWIAFYRPDGRPGAAAAVARAVEADLAAINGIVQVEVVPFARGERAQKLIADDFDALHWLPLEKADFDAACRLGADLRSRGITVPPTDLVIAASAVRHGATLYHLDAHFDLLAKHSDLDARSLNDE